MTKCQYKNTINNIQENMAPPESSYNTIAMFNYYNTAETHENHIEVDRWLRG